jgi:hypothetical protein
MILIPPPTTGFLSDIRNRLMLLVTSGTLLFAGFVIYLMDPVKVPEPNLETAVSYSLSQEDPQYCEHLEAVDQIIPCYTQLTEQLKTPEGCQKIPLSQFQDDCLIRLAAESGDPDICALINGLPATCLEAL